MAYAPGNPSYAAELAYRFPIGGTAVTPYDARALGRFDTLRTKLNEKYGQSAVHKTTGAPREYRWTVGEKTTIMLKKSDNDQILLVYAMAPFASQLATELARDPSSNDTQKIKVEAL